ncbi:MAG: rhamnan synthesis F family protein [Paracoccaceae bacterium]
MSFCFRCVLARSGCFFCYETVTGSCSGSHIKRKLGRVITFLLPDKNARSYCKRVRESGRFDRRFYRKSNPRLRTLFWLAPERHYVLFGERAGLCPNPEFSPLAYANDCTRARKPPNFRPFDHFLKTGCKPCIVRHPQHTEFPNIAPTDRPAARAPVAIVLHLFYHDMWPEFEHRLKRQSFEFDLFVTVTGDPSQAKSITSQIRSRFPRARIWRFPNLGRDILPFVYLNQSGIFSQYLAVCKIHTKRSPHLSDGGQWMRSLTDAVLGSPARTADRLNTFLTSPNAGVWAGDGQIRAGKNWWGCNQNRTMELLRRLDPALKGTSLQFPAGSIYWIKPDVLSKLAKLNIGPLDFEPERALVDGTTAHAVERSVGFLTTAAGLQMWEASRLDRMFKSGA